MTTPSADKVQAITEVLLAWDGVFTSEPGSVLHDLALLSGIPYKEVSATVLYMESQCYVAVRRLHKPEAHRANIVLQISHILPNGTDMADIPAE